MDPIRRSIHAQSRQGGRSYNEYYRESEGTERMEKLCSSPIVPFVMDDESKEFSSMRQNNPFLIANVIEVIFPHLDHPSLKSCRQVCQLWSAIASPLVRLRSKVTLEGPFWDERSYQFLSTLSSNPTLTTTPTLPMSHVTYNVHHAGFSAQNAYFFTTFGHSIRSLVLQAYALQTPATTLGTSRFLSVFASMIGRDCPSLVHLTVTHLQHLNYNDPLDSQIETQLDNVINPSVRHLTIAFEGHSLIQPRRALNCMTLLSKLLAITPNLTKLDTNCLCSGETFMYFLMTLRDSGLSPQLTKFSVNGGPFDKTALSILNSMQFPNLTHLKINTLITKEVQAEFMHFLEKISPTLEKFVMFGDKWGRFGLDNRMARFEEGFAMDFPLMPKLRYFRHQNYEGLRLGNETFLQKLPALEEVVIRDFQPSLGDMMLCPQLTVFGTIFSPSIYRGGAVTPKNPNYANIHVKKVTLDVVFVPSYENLTSIEKVLRMFPNVEDLELAVSFAFQNVYVGHVLAILAESKIKILKIKFYQCPELRSEKVAASFHAALMNHLPRFSRLQRLDLTLDDLPLMSRFNLPLSVVKQLLTIRTLSIAYLTGFCVGENSEETKICRQLLNSKLAQWKVSENQVLFPHYSFYEY